MNLFLHIMLFFFFFFFFFFAYLLGNCTFDAAKLGLKTVARNIVHNCCFN